MSQSVSELVSVMKGWLIESLCIRKPQCNKYMKNGLHFFNVIFSRLVQIEEVFDDGKEGSKLGRLLADIYHSLDEIKGKRKP